MSMIDVIAWLAMALIFGLFMTYIAYKTFTSKNDTLTDFDEVDIYNE